MDAKNEAEFAGFVDKGTQVVLQDTIKQIIENFSQTEALEDILGYLEEMRETLDSNNDKIKEINQKTQQISQKAANSEVSLKNLLQRIQEMEIKISETSDKVERYEEYLKKLVNFFSKPGLSRMFGKLNIEEFED